MSHFNTYYRLDLRWSHIVKPADGICLVKGAYFSGPALKIANEINYPDKIVIDFTPQYSSILSSHYFVEFSWKEAIHRGNNVFLKGAMFVGDYINSISNLENLDYIIIDTEKHEENIHMFNLVYAGKVLVKEGKEKV